VVGTVGGGVGLAVAYEDIRHAARPAGNPDLVRNRPSAVCHPVILAPLLSRTQ